MKKMPWLLVALLVIGIALPTHAQDWQLQFALDNITREINKLNSEVDSITRTLDLSMYSARGSGSGKLDALDKRIGDLERKDRTTQGSDPTLDEMRRHTVDTRISTLEGRNDDLLDKIKTLEGDNELLRDRVKALEDSSTPRAAKKSPTAGH